MIKKHPASFRDPAAAVYTTTDEGRTKISRSIYPPYFAVYDRFMCDVYPELIKAGLIIPHSEAYRDSEIIQIQPDIIPFISYPYEWTFNMLKEAALTTLQVNHIAMKHGLMLKDASVYNLQWHNGRMVFIDTTSFMPYTGNTPWPSYLQFLQNFVNPLLWMKYTNADMRRLLEVYLDGIPVPITKDMLPLFSRMRRGIMVHILAQALATNFTEPARGRDTVRMSAIALDSLLKSLYKFVQRLNYRLENMRGWRHYSEAGSYTDTAFKHKQVLVEQFIPAGGNVLDLGANTGVYSRIAAGKGCSVVSVDSDHDCMYTLYGERNILPLVIDLTNPSPGIGWNNQERAAFWDRVGQVDTILALALVHHLSISHNVPLDMVAELLRSHTKRLIIEWIPPEDKQAKRLLGEKQIPEYNQVAFEKAFTSRFRRQFVKVPVMESERIIYYMESE